MGTRRGQCLLKLRIDRPVVYPHHVLYDSHAKDRDPVSSQDCRGFKVKSRLPKMDSCFIRDVNIPDNIVMAPLTPFTKIWHLKNNGIVVWPKKTIISWMGGDKLSDELSVELKIPATGLAIKQELDVAVDFIALISLLLSFQESTNLAGAKVWATHLDLDQGCYFCCSEATGKYQEL
ncbi:protein JOKA2-like isoform X2 [Primulina eburnea]|uniref:protein JOKA2-like isoform X2 n=1 Tax=Primulina eburnea TaxID=1245227 RepID=UPI003C6BDBF9